MRILFVCLGNLCRSPIAEAIARRRAAPMKRCRDIVFASAGTHPLRIGAPADARARQVAQRRGYDLGRHRTRRVSAADFENFDAILAMDRGNLASLHSMAPPGCAARATLFLDPLGRAETSEVPDPYYGNLAGFEHVFDLCEAGVDALLRDLGEGKFGSKTAAPPQGAGNIDR
jgi:protein-tyrosine phosphatase